MEDNKKEENEKNEQEMVIETRTIEEFLKDLRNQKKWSYLELMEELHKVGITLEEKTIKKWEYGLVYPDIDIIYKLSEIYKVPARNFIEAKNNSFEEGLKSVNMTFIKWFCYFTGISVKIAYYGLYIIIFLGVVFAFYFLYSKSQEFIQIHRAMN